MVNCMEDRYDISVDIGKGKDYGVATLFENGEYRPIAVCDKKMKTFEERCNEAYANKDINALVGIMFTNRLLAFNGLASNIKTLNREFNYAATLWKKLCKAMFPIVGKQSKTTYKTIRRDCAKRNRHK